MRQAAGVWVGSDTALSLPVYFAILSLLSKTVAMLPRSVYRRLERGREKMDDHPVTWLIRNPNPHMTEMAFWELIVHWAVGWGAGAAYIERDDAGRPVALWPIHPACLDRRMIDGELWYFWQTDLARDGRQGTRVLRPDQVLDIHGLGSDGITGYSLIQVGAQAIGVGLAHQNYTASFFARGVTGSGILTHPETLSEQARDRLGASFDEAYGSADGKWRTVVLEEGITYTPMGIPNDDAQLLETGNFNVIQVCRLAGVPPHMVGAMERATWANVEQMAREFGQYGVTPWTLRIEQECDRKLFGVRRGPLYVHHNLDGLLRADFLTRMQGYQAAVNSGWLSPDEIREREEMNPIPGGLGSEFYMQGANKTLDQIANPPEPPAPVAPGRPPVASDDMGDEEPEPEEEPEGDGEAGGAAQNAPEYSEAVRALEPMFSIAADSIARREMKALEAKRRGKPGREAFDSWLAKWHLDARDRIHAAFRPHVSVLADVARSLGLSLPCCDGATVTAILDRAARDWSESAARRAADNATEKMAHGLAAQIWKDATADIGGPYAADAS